ncbi:MAG: transcriptional regulator [Clostridia bacterium]|nr:transcriptional regulator [Clostridia bacterium]
MNLSDLADVFQSRLRLMIISALITGDKTFNEIKEITGATDGNISVQITKLENAGYVTVTKDFIGKKPRTTVRITEKGKQDLKDYIEMLNRLLDGE